jgi:hypothetical protein
MTLMRSKPSASPTDQLVDWPLFGSEVVNHGLEMIAHQRYVSKNNVADDVLVYVEVGVGENDPCADDLPPWNFRVGLPQLI